MWDWNVNPLTGPTNKGVVTKIGTWPQNNSWVWSKQYNIMTTPNGHLCRPYPKFVSKQPVVLWSWNLIHFFLRVWHIFRKKKNKKILLVLTFFLLYKKLSSSNFKHWWVWSVCVHVQIFQKNKKGCGTGHG